MRLRWFNPALGRFEWREMPECDEEATSLLVGCPDAENILAVYKAWRDLGADVGVALIRAGEAARMAKEPADRHDEGRPRPLDET